MPETMDDHTKLIESLFEKVAEYGKTTYELGKLKAVDKTSDIVSSFIPHSAVFVLIATGLVFLNLGIAFWLGEILGNSFYGFFVVAGFYCITGIFVHFFLHKWIKKIIRNYMIKLLLK